MPQGEWVTAYLLHNGPASYVCGKAKHFRCGAVAKASLKMANKSQAVDPKPVIYPWPGEVP
jgi:hypothetical protein